MSEKTKNRKASHIIPIPSRAQLVPLNQQPPLDWFGNRLSVDHLLLPEESGFAERLDFAEKMTAMKLASGMIPMVAETGEKMLWGRLTRSVAPRHVRVEPGCM